MKPACEIQLFPPEDNTGYNNCILLFRFLGEELILNNITDIALYGGTMSNKHK